MDLKTLSVEALKALAYDQIVQMGNIEMNIKAINTELASRKNSMNENPQALHRQPQQPAGSQEK